MIQENKVIEFKKEIEYDDIVCVLNPLLSIDLKQILLMTPEERRLDVSLSFAGINMIDLFKKAGFNLEEKNIYRWTTYQNKLPLGAAFRLARVFGVPVEILFASPLWRTKNDCI